MNKAIRIKLKLRLSYSGMTFQNRIYRNVPKQMTNILGEVLLTVPTFNTSSSFLTIDYLIDLLKVIPRLRGGHSPLPGSATATKNTGAHALGPLRLSRMPLRKRLDFWIVVYGLIAAAKQLLCIHRKVFLIISTKTHHPQLIVVGRRVVTVGHCRPPVPQRPVQETIEAENKESSE
jgi:hypothetical protein